MVVLLHAIIVSFMISFHAIWLNILAFIVFTGLYSLQILHIITSHYYGFKMNVHCCRVNSPSPRPENSWQLLLRNINVVLLSLLLLLGMALLFFISVYSFQVYLIVLLVFVLHLLTGGKLDFLRICCWLLLIAVLELLFIRYIASGFEQLPDVFFNRVAFGAMIILVLFYVWHFFSKQAFFRKPSLLREQFREEVVEKMD
jgi:hypothetical protein